MAKMTLVLAITGTSRQELSVVSLHEAACRWCEHRDRNGIRPHEMTLDCGYILVDGKKVAQLSYTGRLWDTSARDARRAEDSPTTDAEEKDNAPVWRPFRPIFTDANLNEAEILEEAA